MSITAFDPNAPSCNPNNLFGLPHSAEDAKLVVIPVPWEVTTSGNTGTANGPKRVLEASQQVDLFNPDKPELWKQGIAFDIFPSQIIPLQTETLKAIGNYRKISANHGTLSHVKEADVLRRAVDESCKQVNNWVKNRAADLLNKDKMVATLGGDHSTCYGLIQALSDRYQEISVLQIDAHADLRDAFEGLTYSHASIMFNALQLKQVISLTAVGVRDFCQEEFDFIESHPEITCHYERKIREHLYSGLSWSSIVESIIDGLGPDVYLSFDVDGLDPSLCPNTGTPVPGGLEMEEAMYLIQAVIRSGRKLIGFDISECGDGVWDGNVAARLLWRIAGMMG